MASDASTGCAGPPASERAVPAAATDAPVVPAGAADAAGLARFVRCYDDDLDADVCAGLVAGFHGMGDAQQRNGRGVRAGLDDSAWTELDVGRHADAPLLAFFRHRVSLALQRYNRDLGLPLPVPDSPLLAPLVLKRYLAGGRDRFQLHFDAVNEVSDRYLVLLWYLNDVGQGGETLFPLLDLRVAPRRGRLLVVPPYWMFPHAGLPSPKQDKYILSTYLRFPGAHSRL